MQAQLVVLRDIIGEARRIRVPFLAAAVAYYAFVSLVPLLLVGLAVGSLLGGDAIAEAIVSSLTGLLTAEGEAAIRETLTRRQGRGGATLIGVLFLGWSSIKGVRAVDSAFSQVYAVKTREPLLEQVREALVVLGSTSIGVAALVVLHGILPAISGPAVEIVGPALSLAVLPVVFLPMYYSFPDVPMTVRQALPGAIVAAVGWELLASGFRGYAALAGGSTLYGILGGVLLIVTFLYIAASVIIVGAVTNAVLSGRTEGSTDAARDGEPESVDSPDGLPDITELARDVEAIRTRLEQRTVDRDDLEGDLRQYVRQRVRQNHARGWGPYLVLLYGTLMTIGAFYYLSGGWAILAMLVVWLSTLGLYTLMVLVGMGLGVASAPGRLAEWLRSRRQ
ncbi:MAG: YihY/virulence factor BrkB family protein [Halodesulfurarchaeum sp.]